MLILVQINIYGYRLMKISITMSEEVFAKLEGDRGLIPRSTYLASLVVGDEGPPTVMGEGDLSDYDDRGNLIKKD